MTSRFSSRLSRTRLLVPVALAALLALNPLAAAQAQGFSYDMKTTGEQPGRGASASAGPHIMMAAHGQFANGNARLDFTQSPMPGGFMGQGTYMIVKSASSVSTFVDPAKREYYEIDRDDLTKTAAAAQQMTGGLVKTDVSDVAVTTEPLGSGEAIEGYATVKYRITDAYTMTMSIMGRTTKSTSHSTTDLWIAPQLDGIMNPMSRQAPAAPAGPMAALTTELTKAYAKIGKGVVLKTTRTSVSETGSKATTSTMTTDVSNIKRTAINPTVFEVPAGYTKTAGLAGGLGMLNAIGDSLKAARAAAGKQGATGGSSGSMAEVSPGAVVDTVKAGAEQGALSSTKQAASDAAGTQAKKAIGKLFGRP
jgi:hypothetical protein